MLPTYTLPVRTNGITTTMGLLLAAGVCLSAGANIIGIDARNGFNADRLLATGAHYDEFRAEIVGLGHTIVPMTSFEAGDLLGIDAIVLSIPDSTHPASSDFSASEIAAIHAFVNIGGGLWFVGEAGAPTDASVPNANDVLAPYGIVFDSGDRALNGFLAPANIFAGSHPIKTSIDDPMGLDFYRPIASVTPPATDVIKPAYAADRFISVADGSSGGGNVAVVGDKSMWLDVGEGDDCDLQFYYRGGTIATDNVQLLHNIVDYITQTDPFVLGDLNGDDVVDLTDLAILLSNFDTPSGATLEDGDIDGDGDVDLTDLALLLAVFP